MARTQDLVLTDKQKKFCDEYLIDMNATQAAIRAGYSPKSASVIANDTLGKAYIQEYLKEKRKSLEQKHDITLDKVIAELAKIGFSNIENYTRLDNGERIPDFSKTTFDQNAAISEITVERYTEGRGEDKQEVKRVKFKTHDKRAALVDLGKHLGMFKEGGDDDGKITVAVNGGLPEIDYGTDDDAED